VLRFDSTAWRGLSRDRFVEALNAEGIPADGDFYTPIPERTGEIFPLRASEYPAIARRYGDALAASQVNCPVASRAAKTETVWLPQFLLLGGASDVEDLALAMQKIRENLGALLA
jgi:hypothetical protein